MRLVSSKITNIRVAQLFVNVVGGYGAEGLTNSDFYWQRRFPCKFKSLIKRMFLSYIKSIFYSNRISNQIRALFFEFRSSKRIFLRSLFHRVYYECAQCTWRLLSALWWSVPVSLLHIKRFEEGFLNTLKYNFLLSRLMQNIWFLFYLQALPPSSRAYSWSFAAKSWRFVFSAHTFPSCKSTGFGAIYAAKSLFVQFDWKCWGGAMLCFASDIWLVKEKNKRNLATPSLCFWAKVKFLSVVVREFETFRHASDLLAACRANQISRMKHSESYTRTVVLDKTGGGAIY